MEYTASGMGDENANLKKFLKEYYPLCCTGISLDKPRSYISTACSYKPGKAPYVISFAKMNLSFDGYKKSWKANGSSHTSFKSMIEAWNKTYFVQQGHGKEVKMPEVT